ncbi:MAG: YdcF family protein [Clostridiales bacterium]|nr:YdcF family protein [Clostridiales bacterium]
MNGAGSKKFIGKADSKTMTKGKKSIVMNIWITVGILCLIYFILYVVFVDVTNTFTYFWLAAGIGCIAFSVLYRKMIEGQLVLPPLVKWVFGMLAATGFLVILITEVIIILYGAEQPSKQADYVLVLGAQVKGTKPTYSLMKRLDVAYEYLMENPDTVVILSGGQGPGEDVTEAYAMSVYMKAKGLEESRIILEDRSTNTYENIIYSRELMDSPDASVVLVTNYFHVFRGVGVAKKQGLTNVEGLGAPTKWYTVPNQYLREAFAVIKYKLCGQI